MLTDLQGKELGMCRKPEFAALCKALGPAIVAAVRQYLNDVVDGLPLDPCTHLRTLNSSQLGSKLSPWPPPLEELYLHAKKVLGPAADEAEVESLAALYFGLFVWDCLLLRDEEWRMYDPNLSSRDPNREVTGKVYFEQ